MPFRRSPLCSVSQQWNQGKTGVKPKLLILELWALGDLVIASPFIRAASEKYTVTLLAKPFAAEMQQRLWPAVELAPFTSPWTAFRFFSKYNLWQWPWKEMLRLRRELLAKDFDYGVSGRWDPREHFVLQALGVRERLGFPRLKSERYLTQALARPDPLAHRSEYWRIAANALGLALPPHSEIFKISRQKPPVILIHSGAGRPLRVWPLKNFLEIAGRLRQSGYSVQIACDDNQADWWRGQGEKVLCPRSITELLGCLDAAGVFIGNDSGPGHLAASCGLPTFTLFGPQLHEWFAPMHPASEVFEGHACPYKPCSDYCRFPAPFCLWDITVDQVWPRIQKFAGLHLRSAA
jgi:heptosyltransferase-2